MADNIQPLESWNMGTETLKCLARCRDLCSFYSQHNMIPEWYRAAMDWSRNLDSFLNDDERNELNNNVLVNFPKINNGKILPNELSDAYMRLDKFVRVALKFMKAKGLLMPKSSDPRAAVIST
jgi:hypothetical protein